MLARVESVAASLPRSTSQARWKTGRAGVRQPMCSSWFPPHPSRWRAERTSLDGMLNLLVRRVVLGRNRQGRRAGSVVGRLLQRKSTSSSDEVGLAAVVAHRHFEPVHLSIVGLQCVLMHLAERGEVARSEVGGWVGETADEGSPSDGLNLAHAARHISMEITTSSFFFFLFFSSGSSYSRDVAHLQLTELAQS